MSSEYSKYTYTLQEIPAVLTEMGLPPLFTNFDYSLIANTHDVFDKDFLEELWFKHYRYREIGAETIERWLNYLYDTWSELCYKYHEMFEIFEHDFNYLLDNNIIDNNDLQVIRDSLYQDTPQSALQTETDIYATSKTRESTQLSGRTLTKPKYELLSEYAKRIRHIYWEWIEDSEVLFMQVF